jgi:hypothetical protein
MLRRLLLFASALIALALVPAAVADGGGPSPGLMEGWTGVTAPGVKVRYVTMPTAGWTVLATLSRANGRVIQWRPLRGTWGVPTVANDGTTGGLTRDGQKLVLANWTMPVNSPLRASSIFRLVSTKTLGPGRTITLPGDFSFDALSPNGKTLYLIQHVSTHDMFKYQVRAYDLGSFRLSPHVIADRRQAGWVMRGYPLKRVTSADGRFVYTLYQQQGGNPFVHALDATHGTAVCIGVPWKGNQNLLYRAHFLLDERSGSLTVADQGQEVRIDTADYQVSLPTHGKGFPVALAAGLGVAAAALAVIVLIALRRRLRNRPEPVGLPA